MNQEKVLTTLWAISPGVLASLKLVGLITLPWAVVATAWIWVPVAAFLAYCLFVVFGCAAVFLN